MLTNIIAAVSITLVTNTVPSDNAVYEPDPSVMYAVVGPNRYGNRLAKHATEKYITTNVTEVVDFTIEVAGRKCHYTEGKLISSVSKVLRISENWTEAETKTNNVNPAPVSGFLVMPNMELKIVPN